MDEQSKWLLQFGTVVGFSIIFAGILYYLQYYVMQPIPGSFWAMYGSLFRASRMVIGYVIPAVWFTYHQGKDYHALGLGKPIRDPVLSFLGGTMVYGIAIYIFVKYRIFTAGWGNTPWLNVWPSLFLIGIMASVTDFWTRGFVLFTVAEKYSDTLAIITQNIVWFTIHLYEIELLNPYIGFLGGIILTLTLGILGDIIALRTRSIYGLMFGHVLLNFFIILTAKGLVHW